MYKIENWKKLENYSITNGEIVSAVAIDQVNAPTKYLLMLVYYEVHITLYVQLRPVRQGDSRFISYISIDITDGEHKEPFTRHDMELIQTPDKFMNMVLELLDEFMNQYWPDKISNDTDATLTYSDMLKTIEATLANDSLPDDVWDDIWGEITNAMGVPKKFLK